LGSGFTNYTVDESTAGALGPWTTGAVVTSVFTTSCVTTGLQRGSTQWWEVVDADCTGAAASNVLSMVRPAAATLTDGQPTTTSVQLAWNNLGEYGGGLSFQSYDVMEALNGSTFATVNSISSESSMNSLVQGLTPGTRYAFEVVTNDACKGCSRGATSVPSTSNSVAVTPATSGSGGNNGTTPTNGTSPIIPKVASPVTPYWLYGSVAGVAAVGAILAVLYIQRRGREPAPLAASPAAQSRGAEPRVRGIRRRA
jgi:hypothetical protein